MGLPWLQEGYEEKDSSTGEYSAYAALGMSLAALLAEVRKSHPNTINSLDEVAKIPGSVIRYPSPRPAGYAAATWLFIGGVKLHALLDGGASSSGMPEELACVLLSFLLAEVAAGRLDPDSPDYLYEP